MRVCGAHAYIVCVRVYTWMLYMCIGVCNPSGGQRRSAVLSCHILPHSLETGLLTEPGAGLAPVSLLSPLLMGLEVGVWPRPAFSTSTGDLNSGPRV